MDYFKALEAFVAVAEHGSFASASRKLGISPPSITRIVRDLEHNLGIVLFHRTTRLVSMTDVGQSYLLDAKQILADLETANDSARGAHGTPKGHLRITAPTMFGRYYVLPVITEFLAEYADITIETLFQDNVVNLLGDSVDIALRIGHLQDSTLIARHISNVNSVVCASPEYIEKFGEPSSPQELTNHQLIATQYTDSNPRWGFADGLNLQITPRLTCNSVADSISAAKSGCGIARGLSYQMAPHIASGSLKHILIPYMPAPLPVHILYSEGKHASAKVRAFVDLAVKRLQENQFLACL